MAIFEVWDVVKLPFSHSDRPVRQRRPALVVAAEIDATHGLIRLVMITSAEVRCTHAVFAPHHCRGRLSCRVVHWHEALETGVTLSSTSSGQLSI